MVNDDTLLQGSAVVCARAGDTRRTRAPPTRVADAGSPAGLLRAASRNLSRSRVLLCHFLVGDVQHVMGTSSQPKRIAGRGDLLYFLRVDWLGVRQLRHRHPLHTRVPSSPPRAALTASPGIRRSLSLART